MEKDFLKLKTDQKKMSGILLLTGLVLTGVLGMKSYRAMMLDNEYGLPKNEAPQGEYDQEVIAYVGEEKVSLEVTVQERRLSEAEVQRAFLKAEQLLPDLIKGKNESLEKVETALTFLEEIPESPVEVAWINIPSDYLEVLEETEYRIFAILSYEEFTKDYEVSITVLPKASDIRRKLLEMIAKLQTETAEEPVLKLPKEYQGQTIVWRKPLDLTFLYIFLLTVTAVIVLKLGEKRDAEEARKIRLEELEKDYAQIVSKFAMLLSAGLSIRNAWERIVLLYRKQGETQSVIYQEMLWGMNELQKGVSEVAVYEAVGIRIGQIHYKKLMALFISEKLRGSIHLLDAMNQEMLQAWEEKKRKTRQQGEKTGTKLLLPMMGMLGVVFMMILVPAFLSFSL